MEAQPPATHPVRPCYSSVTMKQMFPVVKKLLSILLVPSPLLDQCGALALGGCIPACRMRGCVLPVSPETSIESSAILSESSAFKICPFLSFPDCLLW